VFTRNKVDNNGNFVVGTSSDVLLQGNAVLSTPNVSVSTRVPYYVADTAVGVLLVGNTQSPP